jgi:hypothetical protein
VNSKSASRSISTKRLTRYGPEREKYCLLNMKVQCKTPPLMLMQIRLLRKEGISHRIACSLALSRAGCPDKCVECVMCIPGVLPTTSSYCVLSSSSRTALYCHHIHERGGTMFRSLITSFGAIWLFCKLRTWLPLRNLCSPSASFQLSDSSMRKTYFLPSASRTEARRMCRPLEG